MGEAKRGPLRLGFDRRLRLQFHGSQMGRFETERLASNDNLVALADLSGAWIDRARCGSKMMVLDIDSSVSPTRGEQDGSRYNRHFGCTCYHSLFVFNQ